MRQRIYDNLYIEEYYTSNWSKYTSKEIMYYLPFDDNKKEIRKIRLAIIYWDDSVKVWKQTRYGHYADSPASWKSPKEAALDIYAEFITNVL